MKMKHDDRILVGAIVVILVLLVIVFNFQGFTGSATGEFSGTFIGVSPDAVYPGESILVTVSPGIKGVNEKVSFYQAEDNLRKISVDKLCNTYICNSDSSFNFVIPSNWEHGVYYVQIYDYASKSFVNEIFTVKKR